MEATIRKDIQDQAQLVVDQIQCEINELHEHEMDFFRHGLQKEIETYLEKEQSQLNLLYATQSSQAKLMIKRDVLTKRQQLTASLFDEVKANLLQFCASERYAHFLEQKLSQLVKYPAGILLIRQSDEPLIQKWIKDNKSSYQIQYAAIEIGGFKFLCQTENVELDHTLDQQLADEIEWFQDHSGLVI